MDQEKSVVALPGKAALSVFALGKIRQRAPQVVYAEYIHVLHIQGKLNEQEVALASMLLDYGPDQELPEPVGHHAATVLPRAGTISPWSSKASDIFSLCGMAKVLRVERGVRWFVEQPDAAWNMSEVYDRMTETVMLEERFEDVFIDEAPRPLAHIDRSFGTAGSQ